MKRFLSYLAVEEGVAAGTQRQALNAGVFFLREVRKMELGDFSDYVKANPRKYYPVVYSKGEISRLLAAMRGKWALMARLQYGCGLRISELCRLRVKDVDLERSKLYIRTVQEFLGHACVETTMIYLHVMEDQKDLTLSPLDAL